MKKYLMILITMISLFITTGCWGQLTDFDKISIVHGIAIDLEGDEILVSAEALNPIEFTDRATGGSPTHIVTVNSNSFRGSEKKFIELESRMFFLGHIQVIVISEEFVTKKGINQLMDVVTRFIRVNSGASLIVAKDISAKDVLSVLSYTGSASSDNLLGIMEKTQLENGLPAIVSIYDVTISKLAQGKEIRLPIIRLEGDIEKAKNVKFHEESEIKVKKIVDNIAVFNDSKMVGFLNCEESKAYAFLEGAFKSKFVEFEDEDGIYSFLIDKYEVKNTGKYTDGKIKFKIEGKIDTILAEYSGSNKIDLKEKKRLEKLIKKEIEAQMMATLEKLQSLKSDIVGYGEILRRVDQKKWSEIKNDWPNEFAEVEFEVELEVLISDPSIIINPFNKNVWEDKVNEE